MTQHSSRSPETMRRVNELISESLVVGGREESVPFFCECGEQGCYRAVWLSPARYMEETSDPRWLAVAAEHQLVDDPSRGHTPFALDGKGPR